MDKEKIISFLAFLSIENTELEVLIKETEFDYTNVLLSLIAIKIAENPETVISWYEKYQINTNK
jgi:hypothetical protein